MATRTITAAAAQSATLKVQLIAENGQVWDNVGLDLETYDHAQDTRYNIAITETEPGFSGVYTYTIPATLPVGNYRERKNDTGTGFGSTSDPFFWDGSGTSPVGSGPAGGTVHLNDAILYLKRQARNANSDLTVYQAANYDDAISLALNEFSRDTRLLSYTTTITLTADDPVVDLSTLPDDFRPEMLFDVTILGTDDLPMAQQPDPLDHVVWSQLMRKAALQSGTGVPCEFAFQKWTACRVFPKPTAAYKLVLHYWLPEVTWTHGDASNPLLRTPVDLLWPLLNTLGVIKLQGNNPDHTDVVDRLRADYDKWLIKIGSAGDLGAKAIEHTRQPNFATGPYPADREPA